MLITRAYVDRFKNDDECQLMWLAYLCWMDVAGDFNWMEG